MRQGAHRGLRGPTLTSPWGLLAWLLVPVTAAVAVGPVREADVYWHIRMGEDILANGRFDGDPAWTYGPADETWGTTQAGAEVLLYGIDVIAGWPGIMLFRVLLAAGVMVSLILATTVVVRYRTPISIDRSVAVVSVLAGVMVPSLVQERPQSLSLLLLPWIGIIALRVMYADAWPRWWVLGLVVMGWSWFHGAAIIVGPLLLVAMIIHAVVAGRGSWLPVLGRSLRRGWPPLVAVAAAPMIGPLGLDYYAQAAKIQAAAAGRIVEWLPPEASSVAVWLVLGLVAAWGVAVMALTARAGAVWRTVQMDALLVAVLVVLMTTANRYTAVAILLLAPLVTRRLVQAWRRPAIRLETIRPAFSAGVLGLAVAAAVLASGVAASSVRPVSPDHPLRVWQGMKALSSERRVLVDYSLGGQAGLLGAVVVSIDGRADRYGGEVIDAHREFAAGRSGWRDTLARYPGTTDVVIPSYGGVLEHLQASGWAVACVDGAYTWLTAPGVTGACPEKGDD